MAKRRKHNNKKTFIKRLLRSLLIGMSVMGFAFAVFVYLVYDGQFGPLPSKEDIRNIDHQLTTSIYSEDGKVIGEFFLQNRTAIKLGQINPRTIKALIATEDARFYEHGGIDYRSLFRVLIRTLLLQDRSGGGGSTITQQLAKNLFDRNRSTTLLHLASKIKEIITATRIENIYSKDEILELYFNTVPFGEDVYGVEMASSRFFSKPARSLTVEEGAVLIGMLKANHTYNPRLFPDKSKTRRNVVLAQMAKYDYLSPDSLDYFQELPLELNYNRKADKFKNYAYFNTEIKKKLEAWCSANTKSTGENYNLYTDGLKVYTTLNAQLQNYAVASMEQHMKALQKSFDRHWNGREPWSKALLERSIKAVYKSEEELNEPMNLQVFTWDGLKEVSMTPIDSVKHYLRLLQSGVVSMDPESGGVKVWIGGIDHDFFQYDHVKTTTKRQVGSTFKPFVYAAALEKGMDPCTHISGQKVRYTNLDNWSPDNADDTENSQKYSFAGALAQSVNTVTIKLIEEVGIQRTISLASRSGISSELPAVPSVALGTASISPLEMATAYSMFANEGLAASPFTISKITDQQGIVLYEHKSEPQNRVMKKENAQLLNSMLKSTTTEGTAARLRWKYNLKNDLAGKTGTTQSHADGWFIGYSSDLVTVVWVGADHPEVAFRTIDLGSGSNMALPIFGLFYQKLNGDSRFRGLSNSRFPTLSAEQRQRLDCAPSEDARNFLQKLFNTDLSKSEKTRTFNDSTEKKGFFQKIGDIFKKKKNKD